MADKLTPPLFCVGDVVDVCSAFRLPRVEEVIHTGTITRIEGADRDTPTLYWISGLAVARTAPVLRLRTQTPTDERDRVRESAEGYCPGSAAARSSGDRVTGASRPAGGRLVECHGRELCEASEAHRRQLIDEHAELFAALKVAARVMETFEIGVDAEIRAAIAKAEGGH